MSGTAKRLAEAANQIVNPQTIAEAKQLGTIAPFNYNAELLKAMSADEDGKVKFAVSGFMLRVYGKGASSDLVNFFKKVLNDAGRQYKIVAQSRFDVQYVSPKDTSGIFQKGFEGITVNTGNIIASNKELLDRFGKSVYDAVRKQFPSNSVQVGGAYDGAISGGFNYGKGLGFSGVDIARSMSPKGSMMGEEVQIAEAFKNGDKVKVPHKGKMVSGRIIRYDDGGTSKAQQHGGGYVVDVGEPASIFVTKEKIQKEEVVTEAEWKSLKKTKVDLNALRQQGYKFSVQHGEGDTLYKITGKPSKPATAKKEEVEESVQQIDLENLLVELVNEETLDESLKKKIMAALLALGVAAGPAAAAADVATVNSNQNKTTITQPTKRNLNWRKAAAIAGAGLSTAGLVMSLKRKD